MLRILAAITVSLSLVASTQAQNAKEAKKVPAALKFQAKNIDGKDVDLAKYQGKVVLVVNLASACGYTGQYAPLQKLHEQFGKDGLAVLGFPCNDFGAQEPGSEQEIKKFCDKTYGVTFDLFGKVRIQGKDAHPFFKHLMEKETNPNHAGPVRWNFEKFLIGRDGTVIARFASDVEPDSEEFLKALKTALGQ